MKSIKLSLVAALAAGAVSYSSAVSLEEAIKDVDVSGYAWYRYDSKTNEVTGKDDQHSAEHRFRSHVNFKIALDDDFFGVLGLRYDNRDKSGDHRGDAGVTSVKDGSYGFDGYSTKGEVNVRQIYLGYKAGNTIIQAGRQELGTFFTNDMVGTGIKILNQDISGLILAAVAFDALENDTHIGTARGTALGSSITGSTVTTLNGGATYQNNLYGVAAIGNYNPVAFQFWYAYLENITSLYAVELGLNFDLSDGFALGLKGQVAGSVIDSKFSDNINGGVGTELVDDAFYYGVEATAKLALFDLKAGYLDFSTDKDKLSVVNFEYNGGFIAPGEEILDTEYTFFAGENSYWFVGAGLNLDKFRISADYVDGKNKNSVLRSFVGKTDRSEIVGRVAYKHSKKVDFLAWYSYIEEEEKWDGGIEKDYGHFRFQARYKF